MSRTMSRGTVPAVLDTPASSRAVRAGPAGAAAAGPKFGQILAAGVW